MLWGSGSRLARRAVLVGLAAVVAPGPSRDGSPDERHPLVLISIDGLGAQFVGPRTTPNIWQLASRGVRARAMIPSFPTVTFPNHYTIVTGLYPARHGIVANAFYDPEFRATFRLGDTLAVREARWWGGEPIWATAVKQGVRSATYFWPGSEAAIGGVRPTWWMRFDDVVPGPQRARQVLEWLALPPTERPAFVSMYLSDPDHAGHDYGPDAPEYLAAVRAADSVVGLLVRGLERLGIAESVNLVVVSDHGMAPVSPDRTIALEDYVDLSSVSAVTVGAFLSLWPREGREDEVYRALHGAHPRLAVYRRAEIPERFHYRDNPRVGPIIAVPDEGWLVGPRSYVSMSRRRAAGTHGYDNLAPSMRAVFVARGPAFRRGLVVEPFHNIHVYELMAAVLGLRPAPNDGSLDSVSTFLAR